ncbi:40S ribosomal protein S12, partial [Trichinella nativa]
LPWRVSCLGNSHFSLDSLLISVLYIMEESASTGDYISWLREVLRIANAHDGLAKGLREAVKALDKRQAHLCVLADNCDEEMYIKLVKALCASHKIPLICVDDKMSLGHYVGLCKFDKGGQPRKVVKCSCVVVKDYGEETPALELLKQYMDAQGNVA